MPPRRIRENPWREFDVDTPNVSWDEDANVPYDMDGIPEGKVKKENIKRKYKKRVKKEVNKKTRMDLLFE